MHPLDRWWNRALCSERVVDGADPEWWFPKGEHSWEAKRAMEVCGACEVRLACLAWAVKHETVGVWGGRYFGTSTNHTGGMRGIEQDRRVVWSRKPGPKR